MNIVLHLAYDGTRYFGWQKTKDGPSIEKQIEEAVSAFLPLPIQLQAASRTDAGVHARDQVVNFFADNLPFPMTKMPLVLNTSLPSDIRVTRAYIADDGFHPTLDAKGKEYVYRVTIGKVQMPFDRHYAWHCPERLDITKMEEACFFFIGKKDFTSFINRGSDRSSDCSTEIFSLQIEREQEQWKFRIHGSHFHYKMVRNIVGTLVDIGRKKISVREIAAVFAHRDRKRAGMTAPAHGLVLNTLYY